MKKPLYNSQERWEMREIDCTITAFRKLNLAVLHLCRQIHREFVIIFKL
jgi:hypothetical protein